MNVEEFKRIVTAFADTPADLDLSKGKLLVQLRDEIIEAEIQTRHGLLHVVESDIEYPAQQWVINRIARLPQLADRLVTYLPEESSFVTPTGRFLDQPDASQTDEPIAVDDAADWTRQILSRRPGGTSSILYLTSDAGEGKTTLINHLAHAQAKAYIAKEVDWLLIPITLGGRTFLRFDDVVIADLVNRLRFQLFYYEAFIELVRLGVLVPAFDGFEEVFIESSSGEAMSALSNLVGTLESSGTFLISARQAYYEYKSLAAQTKLLDGIKSEAVVFSNLALNRWSKEQFLAYCRKRGVTDGEEIFTDVAQQLSDENHPLLTRAVLVKRLLDIATNSETRDVLLTRLGNAPHDYFFQFVDTIVEREATEKWIDRSGQPAQPLISLSEHHELLSLIAQEMWVMNTEVLRDDALELLAEIFSEEHKKSVMIARQVKERIKQHALIASSGKGLFTFDHEEFRNFFLGEAVGRRIIGNDVHELFLMLRTGKMSNQALDAASQYLNRHKSNMNKATSLLQDISHSDSETSFTRENCGGLAVRLIDGHVCEGLSVKNVSFGVDALKGRLISGVAFSDCYFQTSSLKNTTMEDCRFSNCSFDGLKLNRGAKIKNTMIQNCSVASVIPPGHENRIFDPSEITTWLSKKGFEVRSESVKPEGERVEGPLDEKLQVMQRALRYFLRSTQISENVLKVRLGVRANLFVSQVLPALLKTEIMKELEKAEGQRHFRLGAQMREIDKALMESNGNFTKFISYFK